MDESVKNSFVLQYSDEWLKSSWPYENQISVFFAVGEKRRESKKREREKKKRERRDERRKDREGESEGESIQSITRVVHSARADLKCGICLVFIA